MNKPRFLASVVAVAALGMAAPVTADSMRCGTRLVTDGDTSGKLRSLCGEPASISRTTRLRAPLVWINGRALRTGFGPVEVPVETWEYNFGPTRLILRVRIEDGVVVDIDTLGYGYP